VSPASGGTTPTGGTGTGTPSIVVGPSTINTPVTPAGSAPPVQSPVSPAGGASPTQTPTAVSPAGSPQIQVPPATPTVGAAGTPQTQAPR
jgi:hypothetical protein